MLNLIVTIIFTCTFCVSTQNNTLLFSDNKKEQSALSQVFITKNVLLIHPYKLLKNYIPLLY